MRTLVPIITAATLFACQGKKDAASGTTTAGDSGQSSSNTQDTSSEDEDPCTPGAHPTLRVGFGGLEYQDLDPSGDDLAELIHGPQGGYHINMALAATGLDSSTPWAIELEGTIDGQPIGDTRPLATMRCNRAEDELQAWGLLLIWDAVPADLHDRMTEVTATVVDSAGTSLSATGTVRIWDPELE